jgi:hypothetical protein
MVPILSQMNPVRTTPSFSLRSIYYYYYYYYYYYILYILYTYTDALEKLSLQSLCKRRHRLDALFFVQVYRGLKSCTSLLKNVSLRVPPSNLMDFSLFGVCPSNKPRPAQCACAANAVGTDLDIFAIGAVSLSHIL